jgi:hypothetical protein
MIKIIGLKQLQKNTKKIRLEVEKGTSFIVLYRSKLLFEIRPISTGTLPDTKGFIDEGIYTDEFIKDMAEAEADILNGDVETLDPDELIKQLNEINQSKKIRKKIPKVKPFSPKKSNKNTVSVLSK